MTKVPLRLVLGAATDMPRSLSAEGLANFIIGSAKLYSGDVELTDPRDRKLAEVLLFYGEWSTEGPLAITDGGELVCLVCRDAGGALQSGMGRHRLGQSASSAGTMPRRPFMETRLFSSNT